jgi:hypothetical protein
VRHRTFITAAAVLDVVIIVVGFNHRTASAARAGTVICQTDSTGVRFQALDDGDPDGLLALDGKC